MRWHELIVALAALLLVAAAPEGSQPEAAKAESSGAALEAEVRAQALRLLEADTEAKLAELARLRGELEAKLEPGEQEAAREIETLIRFYEAMKPKNAATLLERLPAPLAAELLAAMKSRQAGKILDAMQPARAVQISQLMARAR